MSPLPIKSSGNRINVLLALAISLVVNFSYMLLLIVSPGDGRGDEEKRTMIDLPAEGIVTLSPDGHGYLVYDRGGVDSVYIASRSVRFLGLRDSDRIVASAERPGSGKGHLRLSSVKVRNGESFDYSVLYQRPKEELVFALQLCYFFLLGLLLLSIVTRNGRSQDLSAGNYLKRCGWCMLATGTLYFLAPVSPWRSTEVTFLFMTGHYLDFNMILKCLFALAVILLYGWIVILLYRHQAIVLENEQLKNENLSTRYNMLVNQINPHFFFNSLNSLAMLVRGSESERALTYIDQLSYTFRYIIQNGKNTLTTLHEELKFAEAYGYLFKIRYADKLFFDIDVDPKLASYRLPVLSLQELLANAVKHNAITKNNPFRIRITNEDDWLVVSNPKRPKLEAEPSTGTGLKNLNSRWSLIADKTIDIRDEADRFVVRLPLISPQSK